MWVSNEGTARGIHMGPWRMHTGCECWEKPCAGGAGSSGCGFDWKDSGGDLIATCEYLPGSKYSC